MKTIEFTAQEVEYIEALDGEIVQVSFDEEPSEDLSEDPFNRNKCYVSISQNYEFPGKATVEWCDGESECGGEIIKSYSITKCMFELVTENEIKFVVHHEGDAEIIKNIDTFLSSE